MPLAQASNKLSLMDSSLFSQFLDGDLAALDRLLTTHRFRIARLTNSSNTDELIKNISRTLIERRTSITRAPDFMHWLYLFTLRELRLAQTGYSGFDGMFETPEEEFRPSQSFAQELNQFLEWMTDDKMEHYRMRFEDGLVFEEMAAHLQKTPPAAGRPTPWPNWLEDWKIFLKD